MTRMFNGSPTLVELLQKQGASFTLPCSRFAEIEVRLNGILDKSAATLVIENLKKELENDETRTFLACDGCHSLLSTFDEWKAHRSSTGHDSYHPQDI